MPPIDRREFLQHVSSSALGIAAAGAAVANGRDSRAAEPAQSKAAPKIAAFSESFQDKPVAEVCRLFKHIGLDGLDLTVRPGGHIPPERAPAELPQAVQAAHNAGTAILFLTTNITDVNPEAEKLLAVCGEQGITRVKLGYFRYSQFGTLKAQMADIRARVGRIAKLAAKHGVLPCVHIHSGDTIPSHGTQLYQLIQDISPSEVGAYVDPMHMSLEGGGDGWRQGLDLLAPWIALCSVKNFEWVQVGRDDKGQMRWKVRKMPIADGFAPLPEFVAILKSIGFSGIYSLHSEYKGGNSFRDLNTQECLDQTAADLKYFRTLL